jgi:hypothetical protein
MFVCMSMVLMSCQNFDPISPLQGFRSVRSAAILPNADHSVAMDIRVLSSAKRLAM